jgi:DNA-binding MarR family transcriptional regulator
MHMQVSTEEDSAPDSSLSAAWSQVAALASAMDASLGKWLSDTRGIGLTDYRALAHLSRSPEKELRVNDLAQRIGLNQSSATRLVSRLEAKNLAYRDTCPDDGRGVYAVITEHGETLLSEVHEAYEGKVRELLGNVGTHLPQLDAHQLTGALRDISDYTTP